MVLDFVINEILVLTKPESGPYSKMAFTFAGIFRIKFSMSLGRTFNYLIP